MTRILLFLLLSCSCCYQPVFSQTTKDYELVMSKLLKYYNNNEADSLKSLFSRTDNMEWYRTIQKVTGSLRSYKLMSIDAINPDVDGNAMALFKVKCSKKVSSKKGGYGNEYVCMGFSLNSQNKIYGSGIISRSAHIDSLMAKSNINTKY